MAQVTKKSSNVVKDNFYPIVAVAIVILGIFFVINSNTPSTTNNSETPTTESSNVATQSAKPRTLAYRGQEGKTALELLKGAVTIETQGEGEMAFVTTINGYKPDVTAEFWAFYVNDKQAEVGAGSYITKSTDMIEWRLEEIKP